MELVSVPISKRKSNHNDGDDSVAKWGKDKLTYAPEHLVLILQRGKSLFKLRIVLLQVLHLHLQVIQVGLFPLPCLLRGNSVPQQPTHIHTGSQNLSYTDQQPNSYQISCIFLKLLRVKVNKWLMKCEEDSVIFWNNNHTNTNYIVNETRHDRQNIKAIKQTTGQSKSLFLFANPGTFSTKQQRKRKGMSP